MKKKVLIAMYSMFLGGAERSLVGLLNEFDYARYDVDLFLYRHEGELLGDIPPRVRVLPPVPAYAAIDAPVRDVLRAGRWDLAGARIAAKLRAKWANLRLQGDQGTYKQMQYIWRYAIPGLPKLEGSYDAAISFLGPHDFILEKVNAKRKIGWVHTDYATIVHPDERLERRMWSRLDAVVNVSDACEASFLRRFPEFRAKSAVIENIVSPRAVRRQAEADADVRAEMPDDGTFRIVSVGRFSKAKGFDLAAEACRAALDRGVNLTWYIVGYGGEEEAIRRAIRTHGVADRFVLLGKRLNPYPYIRACDLYCQPSRYEGKAVTVREAQILGKPVLITRFPTASSQLREGVDGHVCELSVEGLRDAIARLANDPEERRRLSDACRASDYGAASDIRKLYRLIEPRQASARREAAV